MSNLFDEFHQDEANNSWRDLKLYLLCHALSSEELPEDSTPLCPPIDVLPTSIMIAKTIQNQLSQQPLRVLFDSGGTFSVINCRALPAGATPSKMAEGKRAQTASGSFDCSHVVRAQEMVFPEFSQSIHVKVLPLVVFDQPDCKYDMIIGRDFWIPNEFDISCSTKTMQWYGQSMPMKTAKQQQFYNLIPRENDDELMNTNILESKYDKMTIPELIQQQDHLNDAEKQALREALTGHDNKLFSGKLGKYTKRKIHLDVHNHSPVHCKPYSVPCTHHEVFKTELAQLCKVEVLEPCGALQHAYPTFIIPKKDGRVRWISNFRKLNEKLTQKNYNLPCIQDILQRRR